MILISLLFSIVPLFSFSQTPLVIVHVEKDWAGADRISPEIAHYWMLRNRYILTSEPKTQEIFTKGQKTDAPAGIHDLSINAERAIVCGGYFMACYKNAFQCLRENGKIKTFIIPMKGVFDTTTSSLYETYVNKYHSNELEFKKYIIKYLKVELSQIKISNECILINP